MGDWALKKIGLTGGIASGKSTAVKIFVENGFKVIDSDLIVKNILDNDEEITLYIKKFFGEKFFKFGRLLKKDFGEYIFTYDDARKKYEDFIMPKIFEKIDEEFLKHEKRGEKICILDAPLLIEKNLHKKMDFVVLIFVSEEIQLKRLILRDGICKESAMKRINAQMDLNTKKIFSDFIIDNSKGRLELKEQINKLCSSFKKM